MQAAKMVEIHGDILKMRLAADISIIIRLNITEKGKKNIGKINKELAIKYPPKSLLSEMPVTAK